uniref:Uncharacterized protein n=1 Tax=Pseudomonas phage Touem01 TaxID=3138548 RepID=A0AAU6W1T8_9VIRU
MSFLIEDTPQDLGVTSRKQSPDGFREAVALLTPGKSFFVPLADVHDHKSLRANAANVATREGFKVSMRKSNRGGLPGFTVLREA